MIPLTSAILHPFRGQVPISPLVLIRLAPLGTTACRSWVAAGYPVREVSGGGHRCPAWRRHVLDKAPIGGFVTDELSKLVQ